MVWQYAEGDFFGELALINNSPRQASIKAKSLVKLACISRDEFKRVFGSSEQDILKSTNRYHD